jgi:hypothetical protein
MKLFILILVMLAAVPALAEISLEFTAAQDTTVALTAQVGDKGPRTVDIATNGNGSVTFYWYDVGQRVTVERSQIHYLRSLYPPRQIPFNNPGPDYMTYDAVTASESVFSFSW